MTEVIGCPAFFGTPQPASITLHSGGENPAVIRISSEGFWVRDVKVEQGPGEAAEVYQAFRDFLKLPTVTPPKEKA